VPFKQIFLNLFLLVFFDACFADQGIKRYLIYDDQNYKSDQLEQATRSPVVRKMQQPVSGKGFAIEKAADGHYYINGEVNGYPVTFMVDTGATTTCIPLWMARNAGIRAGLSGAHVTAGGVVNAGTSKGNVVNFGPFGFKSVTVCVLDKLNYPVLGAEILNSVRITLRDGWMIISP